MAPQDDPRPPRLWEIQNPNFNIGLSGIGSLPNQRLTQCRQNLCSRVMGQQAASQRQIRHDHERNQDKKRIGVRKNRTTTVAAMRT